MIRVCHIITKLELGGAQQNTLYTVKHLNRSQFRPLLITSPEGILVHEAEQYDDVKTYFVPSLRREIHPYHDVKALQCIQRILEEELQKSPHIPLIVHTHSSKAGIIGRWAAKRAGLSHIIHSIHGFGFHRDQPLLKRRIFILLERMTAKITSHFIAVSSANIRTGMQHKLFNRSQISLIRSGIDIAQFQRYSKEVLPNFTQWRDGKKQELHVPPGSPVVGIIACFKPQKALIDFVRVIKHVTSSIPHVHAMMVGDGILRPHIERCIAENHLEQQVSLLGWREDVAELLPLFDVFVLTSHWEGLPRVCPQAMAVGLPIVATNVDGIPEAVLDGLNGYVRKPGDILGLAEKITYLLQHPALAREMGRQGRQRVVEFDVHRMMHQQEALYHSLIHSTKVAS
ncbi:hypothetical protein CSA56_14035 [candidate division KSB3 bacterium]|uniref:Glycosyltransferase subfamily 4-like N-terminal domain-containing protein n=1 Tax=candidate division KSB3 bacterium TaxID=2044937 RepID=A0A2G6KCY0_9BACT|nr:MAG: hypothetical protein CSA56_14035 [candidate division KSB3 bacterium]